MLLFLGVDMHIVFFLCLFIIFSLFVGKVLVRNFLLTRNVTNSLVISQASNLLYVDQPTGTGFSYTSDKRDIRHNENGVSNDLYDFLQVGFFSFQAHLRK